MVSLFTHLLLGKRTRNASVHYVENAFFIGLNAVQTHSIVLIPLMWLTLYKISILLWSHLYVKENKMFEIGRETGRFTVATNNICTSLHSLLHL